MIICVKKYTEQREWEIWVPLDLDTVRPLHNKPILTQAFVVSDQKEWKLNLIVSHPPAPPALSLNIYIHLDAGDTQMWRQHVLEFISWYCTCSRPHQKLV